MLPSSSADLFARADLVEDAAESLEREAAVLRRAAELLRAEADAGLVVELAASIARARELRTEVRS